MSAPLSLHAGDIHDAIQRLVAEIQQKHPDSSNLLLLGIANGGMVLAQRLAAALPKSRVGTLDISFHRDDIDRHPIPKEYAPTVIPVDVSHATVILVDDVLFSGRTVKAALDELFDHGRPDTVELAVLVERDGRRLPLAANFRGLTLEAGPQSKVVVRLDSQNPANDSIQIRSVS